MLKAPTRAFSAKPSPTFVHKDLNSEEAVGAYSNQQGDDNFFLYCINYHEISLIAYLLHCI